MHFKKVVFALTAITAVIVLAGCEEEASKTTHAVNINSTEKTVQESPKKGIDRDHTITVNGQEIELETSYKVDERNLNDYVFTTPSIADLGVKLKTDAPQTITSVSPTFMLTFPYHLNIHDLMDCVRTVST